MLTSGHSNHQLLNKRRFRRRLDGFRSLADAWADTATPHGPPDVGLSSARTSEGRERAKARGVKMGSATVAERRMTLYLFKPVVWNDLGYQRPGGAILVSSIVDYIERKLGESEPKLRTPRRRGKAASAETR
jgi:hypothetical protein